MRAHVAYLLLIVSTLFVLGATGGYAWRQRRAPGGATFVLFVSAAWAWTFLVGAMAVAEPAVARVLLSVKYLAIGLTGTATFLFVAQRTGHLSRLTRAGTAALFVIPVLGHLASFSDSAGMVRAVTFGRAYDLTHTAAMSFGPIYWIFTGYCYTLMLWSLAFLLAARRDGDALARTQAAALALGVVAPLACNVLLITGVAPRAFDPMPFGLAISSVCLWWGAFRGRILDLVPVARTLLIDSLDEGILIVDLEGRILDANAQFARVAGIPAGQLVGSPLHLVLDGALDGVTARAPRPGLAIGGRVYDARALDVGDGAARARARILVLHDVTDRQRWQDEQARLISELRDALGQVRTLTGLLPICSGCKRIRDDDGAWQQLEVFIRERTDAEFSHGMCPSCVAEWYPEDAGTALLPK
jgi:N-terminal 7TM region of histidine kinase/PAS domain